MAEARELPLFPLNVVLFPTNLLPLLIFEERYKLMLRKCLEEDQTFGVVLIRSGREAGEPAEPFSVGTQARIVEGVPRPDGRINLTSRGVRPFRVTDILQQVPYLIGRVEFLEYQLGQRENAEALAERLRQAFRVHMDLLASLYQQKAPEIKVDLDPEALSYIVAGAIQIALPQKQDLLETASAEERLEKELKFLDEENGVLRVFLALKDKGPAEGAPGTSFSKN